MRRSPLPLVAAVLAWSLVVPGGCGDPERTCGPGTERKGGECVLIAPVTCGDGTSLQDGACVAGSASDTSGGDDAGGTTADAGGGDDDTSAKDTGLEADVPSVADVGPDVPCVPFCVGRVCGPDGCGATCGACKDPAKPVCDELAGSCEAVCVPKCSGKQCGPNGCGGDCGSCAAATTCTGNGKCLPDKWSCQKTFFGDGAVCDCGCGASDSDCDDGKLPLAGCSKLQKCDKAGKCSAKAPKGWSCAPEAYDALDACDCGCGVPDPDCKYGSLTVVGCVGLNPACEATGTCAACVPDCAGKQCGNDGCGGSCGTCGAKTDVCTAGKCVDPCKPTPLVCQTNSCGPDGCGGSCGACKAGSKCQDGACAPVAPKKDPTSCVGHCGSTAPAGCYCTPACKATGYCCPDFASTCECKPQCKGKDCGSDGCGGSCGTCGKSTPYCNATFKCDAKCVPQCDGKVCGADGCGGTCGTCAAGFKCSKASKCVPQKWTCSPLLFGDKQGCDCGCGAPDSDCSVKDATVFGCPTTSTACNKGVCDVTFCAHNASCGAKWCVGVYAKGDGTYGGVCGTPVGKGLSPGAGCTVSEQCATLACLGGRCRVYCSEDKDCNASEVCLGAPVAGKGLGSLGGFAAVCGQVIGSKKACKSQADCKSGGETCIAVVDAKTLGPRLLCAAVGKVTIGASCAAVPCAAGQLCAGTKKGFVCTLPCPGGAADCPKNWSCEKTIFNGAGTADPGDDPKVAACVPK